LDSNVESTEKMLGEIKRIVKEAIEESKREDIIKLGTAIDKIADVLKSMLEELKKHTEILEKHTKILEEHTKILERHTKILEEHSEMLKEHGKTLMELKIAVGSLGKRVGRDLEKMILSLYKDNLAQLGIDPEKARRFIYTDLDGKLGVRGARYEFDVIIEDGGVTIIEVKSKAERGDIDWLYDRVERTRQLIGNVKRIVIIAVNIDREALERARELGINTIYGSVID
jgi:hypothetical protein